MGAAAPVGVDDDLAAGQAGVAVGAADDELAGGVDVQLHGVHVKQALHLLSVTGHDAGDEDLAHVLLDGLLHLSVGCGLCVGGVVQGLYELVVLGGYYDGVDSQGAAVVAVLDCHLALGVGAEVADLLAFAVVCHFLRLAAYGGEFLDEGVAEVERQGQEGGRLVGGVAEHHALVPGALELGCLAADAAAYVGALLVDGVEDAYGVAVEAVGAAGVADLLDDAAHGLLYVDVCLGVDLSGDDGLAGGDEAFDGHAAVRVAGQELVEQCVRDLVGHLVGMALGH